MRIKAAVLAVFLALTFIPAHPALPDDAALLDSIRPFAPQRIVDLAGGIQNVEIDFKRADLEGTSKFDFIVAAYLAPEGGKVRVLRVVNGQLQVAADLDNSDDLDVSGTVEIRLIDVDNDGRPEVAIRSFGSRTQYDLDLFKWTGRSLESLLPVDVDSENAQFIDLDGDGVMEIVAPPNCTNAVDPDEVCRKDFAVYRLGPSGYALAFTSSTDPTGRSAGAASGVLVALPRQAVMHPDSFPLPAITQALQGQSSQGGVVTVQLSDLIAWVAGVGQQPLDVNDIDPSSLVLGRNIRPISTLVVPPSSTDTTSGSSSSATPFLQAQFDRQTVLTFLAKVQFNKPLEVGDSLTLTITGKMKNGVPLQAGVIVKIVAD